MLTPDMRRKLEDALTPEPEGPLFGMAMLAKANNAIKAVLYADAQAKQPGCRFCGAVNCDNTDH